MGLTIDSEPGVILHTRPYQENSLLVELYTLNYGRISAVARISKKVSSRARGIYQPYALLKLSLSKGKSSLFSLKDAYLQRPAFHFEIPRLFSAIYTNELMINLVKVSESDPKLFASYIKTLERLEGGDSEALILRDFEADLIESLGYSINYECADGSELDGNEHYFYSLNHGFVLDNLHETYTFKGCDLIALKQYLNTRSHSALESVPYFDKNKLSLLKTLNKTVIDALLNGKALQSRELYAQYLTVK